MLKFYKYHGAGNDFILIDNRDKKFNIKDVENIKLLCHRRFGVGSDGIITLEEHPGYDFEMIFANPDGSIGAMCGNGGRCIVHFANNVLKIIKDPKHVKFLAVDGEHEAEILDNGKIKLKMKDMENIEVYNGLNFLMCGTAPHYIQYVINLESFPINEEARKIRDKKGNPRGNVNYVEIKEGVYNVRTYERGVEDETWACGTGATSVAIASHHLGILKENICHIKMPGGNLTIEFKKAKNGTYQNIWLTGPAVCVFEGEIK
ncbi:diaminopimelate epimerase [Candidatus Nomurabacteria bacterium RIFCSPHIGHO2_12_FULL_42_19]|nr:MAG: diaminopimelate epimerase [Candidatus Nomurabacteria bacterium RIFCSPHIGHO2_12_FULL_42_19]